ncbi:metallopeptidase family M24 [Mytilinidion resinicola]|uniref:Metallopeptidase family M24 n=1 Tax=Mytilinidion resinicola TaxID=574789 RepID=A0A6A6YTK0_9PEZI|nr:metallopeptidase family M24 [Mytilinidion resinicola]KAF2811898.1 metallopeptidase family M24 [Mytilinidion resinicola]
MKDSSEYSKDEGELGKACAHRIRIGNTLIALLVPILVALLLWTQKSVIERVQQCSVDTIHRDTSFLHDAQPITSHEFINRRNRLAKALAASGVDGFVLEPGYTFAYYGNISQTSWEPWEPEERPFLMIIEPRVEKDGQIHARTSFLSPKFEEGRVRMLGIPSEESLNIVTWEEHWNPYQTLKQGLFSHKKDPLIMVDEEMRDFIVRGLSSNGFNTVGLDSEAEAVRQKKSSAEIEILRAVNTGTVEAVRAVRSCLVPGLTEDEVMTVLDNTLLSIGFSLFFDLVLFEENAALPHGGFVTGDKVLEQDTMVLIDVGAHYLGYSSDICRSFFIPPLKASRVEAFYALFTPGWFSSPKRNSSLREEKLKVWQLVLDAQSAAAETFIPGNRAKDVDIAARAIITQSGYGAMFTHRVGHGIGIKAHEAPYLHQGNNQVLRAGMTFTNEPGVYLIGRFGIRHEDVFLVKQNGPPEVLSGRRATGPYDP